MPDERCRGIVRLSPEAQCTRPLNHDGGCFNSTEGIAPVPESERAIFRYDMTGLSHGKVAELRAGFDAIIEGRSGLTQNKHFAEEHNLAYVSDLIAKLKAEGVRSFKDGGLEIVFGPESHVGKVSMPKRPRLPTAGVLAEPFAPSPEEMGQV